MFTSSQVLETIEMVEKEHLDIRTVTMGISLLPCIRETAEKTASAVYDRVMRKAEIQVLCGGEIVQRQKREHMAPGEMERIILPAKLLQNSGDTLTVRVCEEAAQ